MSEVRIPDYLDRRLAVLRSERLRIDGAIAEIEALRQSIVVPSEPVPEPEKPAKVRRGNNT